ncbi:MAG: CHAT domain-containing protein [Candidatus Viridilinea halotolerans]|uniref:CHAT domain-containing protein n=1 Tax=Candidatus Viridilinea halotolerans TaxID=2491704 RepID=A0A426TS16_9CHLR|nr:MAG: CHAT domain-containing protein [Candidatus Viridilinea halotolerans]
MAYCMRLLQLAERDPRRAGRSALCWLRQGGRDAYVDLAIGWALLRWERLAAAEPLLAAAAVALPPNDHGARLRCQRAQLMLAQLQGAQHDLQERWEGHVAACAALATELAIVAARCEQVAHLNLLGRYSEARALVATVAPLAAKSRDLALRARWLHVSGVAAIGCGDLAAARQALEQAAQLFHQLGYRAEVARVAFEQGWLAIRSGRLPQAARALRSARALYQCLDLPFRVALCERDLGTVAYLQNEYDQALAWGVAARSQFLALGRAYHAAGCDFNLGAVAHVSGIYDLALVAYQRAEAAYREHGHPFHAFVAGRNQVLVLCAQDRPQDALALADGLAAQSADLGDELGACELLAARAQALRGVGRSGEAAHAWRIAAQRFAALGNHSAAATCRLELAWLQLASTAPEAAAALLHGVADELSERPAQLWRVHYGLGLLAARRGDLTAARDAYLSAVQLVAGMRRRLASEHASSGIFRQAQALHHAAMKLAAQMDDHEALLLLADHQHSLSLASQCEQPAASAATLLLREAAGKALRQMLVAPTTTSQHEVALNHYRSALLQMRHATPRAAPPYTACELAHLRQELTAAYGTAWTLLCPLFTDELLLLLGVTPEGSFCTQRPYTPQLRELLDRACLPTQRQMTYRDLGRLRVAQRPPWQTLNDLGNLLLPPWLRARLGPQQRLLILPSGPLHGLAWAALRVEGAWLCEEAILLLLPHLRAARTPPRIAPDAPALLIGCSQFGPRATELPLVGAILDLVAQTWRGPSEQLRDGAASVAALRAANRQQALRRYGLIQVASHAQLGGGDGLLAQIQLADDALLLDEVAQLRLQADLVVLSACEGGASTVLPGDEVLSLSRALLTAGARSVIASLWTVYDQGLLALLQPLYQALAAGHDAPTALALAQRTLCNRPVEAGSMLHTPYIWGGFHVVCR